MRKKLGRVMRNQAWVVLGSQFVYYGPKFKPRPSSSSLSPFQLYVFHTTLLLLSWQKFVGDNHISERRPVTHFRNPIIKYFHFFTLQEVIVTRRLSSSNCSSSTRVPRILQALIQSEGMVFKAKKVISKIFLILPLCLNLSC